MQTFIPNNLRRYKYLIANWAMDFRKPIAQWAQNLHVNFQFQDHKAQTGQSELRSLNVIWWSIKSGIDKKIPLNDKLRTSHYKTYNQTSPFLCPTSICLKLWLMALWNPMSWHIQHHCLEWLLCGMLIVWLKFFKFH